MKGLFAWVGYPASAIDYDREPRFAGRSKWSYPRLVGLSVEGITSFTIFPLRVVTILGLVISADRLCSTAAYVFVRTLIFGDRVAGFPTLLLTMLLLGGMRAHRSRRDRRVPRPVFNEVKGRPLFPWRRLLVAGRRRTPLGQPGDEHA